MIHQMWRDGILVREHDDTARTVTTWADGAATTRAYTSAENAEADRRATQQAEATNESSIRSKLRTAIQSNNDYLAITTPTGAQTTAQVKALTRQTNALIRLAGQQFDTDT